MRDKRLSAYPVHFLWTGGSNVMEYELIRKNSSQIKLLLIADETFGKGGGER